MKLKRIAHNAALGTIGYLVGGITPVTIYKSRDGLTKDQIVFDGLFRDFERDKLNEYAHCAVIQIRAEANSLLIAIDERGKENDGA